MYAFYRHTGFVTNIKQKSRIITNANHSIFEVYEHI